MYTYLYGDRISIPGIRKLNVTTSCDSRRLREKSFFSPLGTPTEKGGWTTSTTNPKNNNNTTACGATTEKRSLIARHHRERKKRERLSFSLLLCLIARVWEKSVEHETKNLTDKVDVISPLADARRRCYDTSFKMCWKKLVKPAEGAHKGRAR